MSVRVVVADDHPMYRFGLGAVLAQSDGIEVVGSVSSGDELVAAVAELQPDVVVTDLSMPGTDGVAAMQTVLAEQPGLAVLALTMHDDDEHVRAALRAGASGYLVKGADGESIVRAVHAVAAGDAVYGGDVARRLTAGLADAPPTGADDPLPPLTPREQDVLELLVVGCRNREIGQRLGMSEKTVRNHVSHLLVKFAVEDRTGLALRARDAGLRPGASDDLSRR
jgi:DNA-binding NarL/FixJ family response regulator